MMVKGMTEEYGSCEEYRQTVLDRANGNDDDLGPIWLDDGVGALILALEEREKLDNTIFIFQQDHGMETKGALYENGIRIPQFIHYPNGRLTGGIQFDAPVSTIDIGPTLMDLAGISTLPYKMDGISWKNAVLLSNSTDIELNWNTNRCLFYENEQDRAVRCGCYKYLRIYEEDGSVSGTYRRGNRGGYSIDLDNLFDLCGGTGTDYVTNMTSNQEQEGLNMISDSDLEQVVSGLIYWSSAYACSQGLAETNLRSQ